MKILGHYYAAVDPDGYLLPWMIFQERRAVIRAVERSEFPSTRGKRWRQLYRDGWRVAKVRVVPVEDGK